MLKMLTRNNEPFLHCRKRIQGRQKKHLGDMSLMAGLPAEAWNYYQVRSIPVYNIPTHISILPHIFDMN